MLIKKAAKTLMAAAIVFAFVGCPCTLSEETAKITKALGIYIEDRGCVEIPDLVSPTL